MNLNPIVGRELMDDHMCVVVSDDVLMAKAELAIVVPLTSHPPRVRAHVPLDPKLDKIDTGPMSGSALCDQIRSVSTIKYDEATKQGRFRRYAGTLSRSTMQKIESELGALLSI